MTILGCPLSTVAERGHAQALAPMAAALSTNCTAQQAITQFQSRDTMRII